MQKKFKIVGSLLTLSIIYLIAALLFSYDPTKNLWAQVQSVVGTATWGDNGTAGSSITWRRWANNIEDNLDDPVLTAHTQNSAFPEVQNMALLWGGDGEGAWHAHQSASAANQDAGSHIAAVNNLTQASDGLFYMTQSLSSIAAIPNQAGFNVPATGPVLFSGDTDTWHPQLGGTGTNLSATTSVGVPVSAPFATWTITNAPAAATQAIASKAAGGGTVRHVVTSWKACLYTATAATIPVAQLAVTRDGATGAGTIKENFAVGSGVVQGAQCVNSSPGMTWIGTANTAMTIEFAAAPPANVLQTVNLTGYSVP